MINNWEQEMLKNIVICIITIIIIVAKQLAAIMVLLFHHNCNVMSGLIMWREGKMEQLNVLVVVNR